MQGRLQRHGGSFSLSIRNPKELTVHFGGKVGAAIRQNYMDLQVEQKDGSMVPLLPEIQPSSRSYTYRASAGLLFSTQFTQPAIMLVEKGAFVELLEAGYVPVRLLTHPAGSY